MKKISILLLFTLFIHALVFGATPTVPPSNMTFSALDGGQLTGNVTVGNGTYRIMVMKQGSPVTGVPVNGIDYTSNAAFGAAGSAFTAPGEFVIAKSSWGSFTPTNLQPGTTYYFAVFEYNGSGAGIQYLNLPATGSATTMVAPATPASAVGRTAATGNTMTLNWTKGNGTGRLLVARKGSPVSFSPVDLTNYWADENFGGTSNKVATDHFIIYEGAGASATVKGLEPNATYHFAVFEYNGNVSPVFHATSATGSFTTNAGPTVGPSSVGFSWVEGNSMSVGVTQGNGTRRIFIGSKSPVTFVPVNGTTYTANAAFGAGQEVIPGEFILGTGGATSVSVTALEANTTYHFRVFEYDVDKNGFPYYLTSASATRSGTPAITPTTVCSNLTVGNLTGSGASVSYTAGNGTYRMVVMKAGSPVDAIPAMYTRYSANAAFGSGTQITPGNYVMHAGINGASFNVSNLVPGTTYHVAIFEFNGNTAPVYSATAARISFTPPLQPTAPSTAPWTAFVEGGSFRAVWTNGGGSKRLAIARKGAAVTAAPVDGGVYTANNTFGSGQELEPGQFIVYNGAASEVDLKGLEVATTYHLAVYEYNVGPDGTADYLTSARLVHSASTATRPTTQVSMTAATNIQATQATINLTKGNGSYALFIMKKESPVDAVPQDLVSYTYNSNFGGSNSAMGNGNYAIAVVSNSGAFNVTTLQPNTTYYVTAYEFKGLYEPAYLFTGAPSISFTTADVPGAVVPSTPASAPVVTGIEGNKFTFKWTNGNGEKRIVVARAGSAVSFTPSAGTSYTSNAAFGSGTDLGGGQYVVYSGNNNSIELSSLQPNTAYHFAVFEMNGTGALARYGSAMAATGATAAPPAQGVGSVQTSTASGQLTLTWANGSGTGRLVVLREDAAVTAQPSDLSVYPANAAFKTGSQISAGTYAVYAGTGNSVTITGLTNNKTYHYSIFEYNGSAAPVYNIATPTAGSAIVSSALPVKLQHFTAAANSAGVAISWSTWGEYNSASFIVERSASGGAFLPVHTRGAAGHADVLLNYSWNDNALPAGTYQYRLKMLDTDGRSRYSPVAIVTVEAFGGIAAYPNPVNGSFRLRMPAGVSNGTVRIYNSRGAALRQQRINANDLIEVQALPSGIYTIELESSKGKHSCVMVKQ